MEKLLKTAAVLVGFALAAFTSCDTIFDDLAPCEQGLVRVNVYVERFLGNLNALPGEDNASVQVRSEYIPTSEECSFGERIKTLHYYLYRDKILVERGEIDNIDLIEDSFYVFERRDLPHGDYHLVFTANCAEKVFKGGYENPSLMTIMYQENEEDAADFFVSSFEFTVKDNTCRNYDAQLKRVHGVVRYTFNNVDPDIKAIEVTMDGLTSSSCILGTYSEDYTFVKRIAVNQPVQRMLAEDGEEELLPNEPTIVGLFPTTENGASAWRVRVFKDDGDVEYFSGQISDNVRVARNDLLDLSATFDKGRVMFYVNTDLVWEGVLEGGSAIVD